MPRIESSETLDVRGILNLTGSADVRFKDNAIARTKLVQDALAESGLRLDDFRVWDNLASLLPGTAAADDLAIIEGTFGTDSPRVQTSDAATGSATQRARVQFTLPPDYAAGEDIQVSLTCGMETISDGTATVDVECYAYAGDGTVGSDLCTTGATTINSATHAAKAFTITPTGLVAGDVLDLRFTIAITDSATGSGVIGEIAKAAVQYDRQ